MSANVETMFYVRKAPWHGLGVRVLSAPDSREALHVARIGLESDSGADLHGKR